MTSDELQSKCPHGINVNSRQAITSSDAPMTPIAGSSDDESSIVEPTKDEIDSIEATEDVTIESK